MRDSPPTADAAESRVAVGSLFREARAVPADVTPTVDPDGGDDFPGRVSA